MIRIHFLCNVFAFKKCVDKDPGKRWTCEELLNHPYFENFQLNISVGERNSFLKKQREKSTVGITDTVLAI